MIFLVLTLIAIITIIILANQKELYFVSLALKNSKSYLSLHIIQILIILKLQYEIEHSVNP